MWRRVLVPLDGSLEAEQAIPIAAQLARHRAGTVVLTYIAPVGCHATGGGDGLARPVASLHNKDMDVYARARSATGYLAHAAAHGALGNVSIESGVYMGPRVPTILAAARAAEADMLVVYDHDRSALDGRPLGSVAHQVSMTAEVPVLVVRRDQALRGLLGASRMRPLRAVVGLDGSAQAEALLPETARLLGALAAPGLGALHLLHVARNGESVADAKAYLSAVALDLRRELVGEHALLLTWSVVHDADPAAALVALTRRRRRGFGVESSIDALYGLGRTGEIAAEEFDGADLLVIAHYASHHPRRDRASDTLERVLRTRACPMLVMREPFASAQASVHAMSTRDVAEAYLSPV